VLLFFAGAPGDGEWPVVCSASDEASWLAGGCAGVGVEQRRQTRAGTLQMKNNNPGGWGPYCTWLHRLSVLHRGMALLSLEYIYDSSSQGQ